MKGTITAFVAVLLLASRAASADEAASFPQRSHVAIVLDNLGGFVNSNTSYPNSNPAQQDNGLNLFGWFPTTPIARFGVHGILGNGLTLGGGLIWAHSDIGLGVGSVALGGGTQLGIAPRVGYATSIGTSTAIWLRGGFSYLHLSDSNDNGDAWQFSPGGEVYLVYTPVNHFGIMVGPFAEFGVAGNQSNCSTNVLGPAGAVSQTCTSQDIRTRFIGLTFGVLADF